MFIIWGDDFKLSEGCYNPKHSVGKYILSLPSFLSKAYPKT